MVELSGGSLQPALFAIFAAVASSQIVGCGGGGGGAVSSDVPPPASSTAAAAIAALWSTFKRKDKLGRLKSYFVIKRAESVAADHADWAAEPGQPKIVQRLQAELALVESYVTGKLGTPDHPGSLYTGTNDPLPHHLDLDDVANYKTGLSAGERAAKATDYRDLRRERGTAIIWRAAAVEQSVWQSGATAALNTAVLDFVLDRRLRVIERMECNVNIGGPTSTRTWSVAGANGPWKDGYRVRMFEYGFLPRAPFDAIASQMDNWAPSGNMLVHRAPYVPLSSFVLDASSPSTPWVFYRQVGSNQPAQVIQDLFTPNSDFLHRSWLYCDHVISALLIEALWLGLHRRDNDDTTFEAQFTPLHVYLGPAVHNRPRAPLEILMDHEPSDTLFDNTSVPIGELQIGDHLVVWNNVVYDAIARGAWHNEFALVMDLDADPLAGVSSQTELLVAGHGLDTQRVAPMLDKLAKELKDNLDKAYAAIDTAVQQDPAVTSVSFVTAGQLVRWDPYGEFSGAGSQRPWWIRLDPTFLNSIGLSNPQDALGAIPRTIGEELPAPAGYNPPPGPTGSVYFPLFEPAFPTSGFGDDPWTKYLESRKLGGRGAINLEKIVVDGKLTSGLFYRSKTSIPIIRPQAA